MSQPQSQKHGARSEAQKTERAREGYDPIPPSNPVAGAFGDPGPKGASDSDVALKHNAKNSPNQNSRNQTNEQ